MLSFEDVPPVTDVIILGGHEDVPMGIDPRVSLFKSGVYKDYWLRISGQIKVHNEQYGTFPLRYLFFDSVLRNGYFRFNCGECAEPGMSTINGVEAYKCGHEVFGSQVEFWAKMWNEAQTFIFTRHYRAGYGFGATGNASDDTIILPDFLVDCAPEGVPGEPVWVDFELVLANTDNELMVKIQEGHHDILIGGHPYYSKSIPADNFALPGCEDPESEDCNGKYLVQMDELNPSDIDLETETASEPDWDPGTDIEYTMEVDLATFNDDYNYDWKASLSHNTLEMGSNPTYPLFVGGSFGGFS